MIGILLSLVMMFTMTATKPYHNKNYQIRNLLTLSMTLTVSFLLFFQYFIDYKTFSFISEKFIFFSEPIFYLSLSLNFLTQYIGRVTSKDNEKNLVFVQFASFIFIALVPITSYLMLLFFDFENTIDVQYDSFGQMIFISFILLFLSLIFFIDKIKKKSIIRVDRLISFILVSTVNFVLINKLMQMYDTEAVYFSTMIFNSVIWIAMATTKKEHKKVEKRHYNAFILFGAVYLLYSYLNIIIVNYLPSEHIAIFRILAAVLASAFFDYFHNKKANLSIKDIIILILIFSTLFLMKF